MKLKKISVLATLIIFFGLNAQAESSYHSYLTGKDVKTLLTSQELTRLNLGIDRALKEMTASPHSGERVIDHWISVSLDDLEAIQYINRHPESRLDILARGIDAMKPLVIRGAPKAKDSLDYRLHVMLIQDDGIDRIGQYKALLVKGVEHIQEQIWATRAKMELETREMLHQSRLLETIRSVAEIAANDPVLKAEALRVLSKTK